MPLVMIVSAVVALVVLVPLVLIVVKGSRVVGTVTCPANEWTPIVKNFGTGFARTISVELIRDGERTLEDRLTDEPDARISAGEEPGDGTDADRANVEDPTKDDAGIADGDESDDVESVESLRIRGRWREISQRRIIKDESVAGDLSPSMTFQRRWIDWRYRIEIHPDEDVTAIIS